MKPALASAFIIFGLVNASERKITSGYLSRTPLTIRRRAPQLGEHTDQILKELGYEAAAIEKLRADRVV